MTRFVGRTALVTGAATGIGRAAAVRFAAEGASLAINHFGTPHEAAQTAEQCRAAAGSAKILVLDADVSSETAVDEMFERTLSELGRLDALINNAGILGPQSATHAMDMAAFDRVMAVNLRGAALCCRAAIRHFLERGGGGAIVNNSSVHEIIPKPEFLPYSISKGALINLTRTLALEYADRGVRVNAVGPGAIETPLNAGWTDDPAARRAVESHIPMKRAGKPEEIAAVMAFLASDEASYITGQTIFACGGLSLFPEFRENWAS
jgi:glucose 1-dehydrogenase